MYKQVSNLLFYYINTNPHNKRKLVEVRGSGQKALKMTNKSDSADIIPYVRSEILRVNLQNNITYSTVYPSE